MRKNKILENIRKNISWETKQEMDYSFSIVERIDTILTKQQKSRKDLAIALGKSESEISKWMTGTHNFTLKTISKIESVLGESLIEIPSKMKEKTIFISSTTKATLLTKGNAVEYSNKLTRHIIH